MIARRQEAKKAESEPYKQSFPLAITWGDKVGSAKEKEEQMTIILMVTRQTEIQILLVFKKH